MRITQTEFYKKLLGRSGELRIAKFLKRKGYKILEKNYRTNFGEADIIALYGDFLVFVEVKTRSDESYGTPAEAVGYKKRRTYEKLAEYFVTVNPEYDNHTVRFDVAQVLNDRIDYIENAFVCGD